MALGAKGAVRGGSGGGTVSLGECEMVINNGELGRRPPAGLLWPPAGF